MSIKKITLRLYGTMRLSWYDLTNAPKTGSARYVKYDKVLYEHDWRDLEAGPRGSGSGSRSGSTTPANVPTTHILPAGKHEFPFEVILPGNLDESVEGLEEGQVVYKLVATIERGRFANNIVRKKHIRVVRTLGPDVLELNQTMCIENTWPQKVHYTISIPTKAIAIGSFTMIDFTFSPLFKGLTLGKTKIQLAEYRFFANGSRSAAQSESTVTEMTVQPPAGGFLGQDEWAQKAMLQIPSSLTKCTQDCQISNHIKVSHKLKFWIGLVNPDGHTSELRASIQISLFISPNVSITSRQPTEYVSGSSNRRLGSRSHEEVLFTPPPVTEGGGPSSHVVNAPPSYHDHIYDALWGDIPTSHFNTPLASGQNTPLPGQYDDDSGAGFPTNRLLSNLYALQERQNDTGGDLAAGADHGPISASGSSTMLAGSVYADSTFASGANSPRWPSGAAPAVLPIPIPSHLTGGGHPETSNLSGASLEEQETLLLSRVPSYNTAVAGEAGEFSPSYEVDAPPSSSPSSPVQQYHLQQHTLARQKRQSSSTSGSFSNLNSLFSRYKKHTASGTQLSTLSYHIAKSSKASAPATATTSNGVAGSTGSLSASTSAASLSNSIIITRKRAGTTGSDMVVVSPTTSASSNESSSGTSLSISATTSSSSPSTPIEFGPATTTTHANA